jgi:hypothetical protein
MYAAEYYDDEEEEEEEEYGEEELSSAPLPTQTQTRLRADEALVMSPSPDQGLIGKLTTWIRPINYTYDPPPLPVLIYSFSLRSLFVSTTTTTTTTTTQGSCGEGKEGGAAGPALGAPHPPAVEQIVRGSPAAPWP